MKLFELAPVRITQLKLWHITEKTNLAVIEKEGMMYPKTQMRGAQYQDYRLHFFTNGVTHQMMVKRISYCPSMATQSKTL